MLLQDDDPQLMPWELFEDTVLKNPYIRQEPSNKQIDFLRCEHKYVLFGGSGGGGKSSALLMAALQFCHDPLFKGYSALIVRRNLQDLKMAGGLIDRALSWLDPFLKKRGKKGNVDWNGQEHRLRFPNDTSLQFGYADNEGDERRYHGAEFQFVGVDEGAQFSEKQLTFFMSERIRKTDDIAVPLRFRIATTPGGVGHEFIKKTFIDPGQPGFLFLPATVADNPALDSDAYADSLSIYKTSDPLRYRQMLLGDWNAVDGGRFKKEWFGGWRKCPHVPDTLILTAHGGAEVERFRLDQCQPFQTCDPAASTSAAADYFGVGTYCVTPRANLVWLGCHRGKHEIHEQVATCQRLYRRYTPQFITVEKVMNQTQLYQLLVRSTNPVMTVIPVSPMGQDKLARATGAIALAASGRIFLPEHGAAPDFPLDDVIAELVSFTGEGKRGTHDDMVDLLSYAHQILPRVRPGFHGGQSKAPWKHTSRLPV